MQPTKTTKTISKNKPKRLIPISSSSDSSEEEYKTGNFVSVGDLIQKINGCSQQSVDDLLKTIFGLELCLPVQESVKDDKSQKRPTKA